MSTGTEKRGALAARRATIAGLLMASAGLVVAKLGGVVMPAVPPALVIMLVAALFVLVRWRWTPIVGVLAALAEGVGFFASGSYVRLVDVAEFGISAGSWLRLLGVITAVVFGLVALKAAD
ncbi:hypothetical protein [Amycolatopsis sp. 195334CR]|uniref:hypothetical protein n=1 Tax=Amycolatopsis sp. 195334CR TaxID=2814588 RepID=UPI001A909307|nr:hypothetical protein [Amycolatopsis sp. 195334CR]MBN6033533.1 hypothetical protein [Amycolatopsis sp. 195334CR]